MASSDGSSIGKLDLDNSEIQAFPKLEKLFKQTNQSVQLFAPLVNSDAESRLLLKLRHEARNRRLGREAKELPTLEEIERLKDALLLYSSSLKVDGLEMIYYDGFKAALRSAGIKMQKFVPVKLFVALQNHYDWDAYGHVPVHCIISYVLKKREKLKFLIALHWYDDSHQGYLTEEVLKEYLVEQMLPRIPSLASVLNSPMQEYYLCMATRKFFFLLDPQNLKKLRIIDIVASGLLEEMLSVSESNNEESVASIPDDLSFFWFSKENCENIQKMYIDLDTDGNGLLSFDELRNFRQITDCFAQRVFETVQTYDHDQIDLRGFCDLLLAMENKSDVSALNFYFRVLDVDGDGYLNASDLAFFYRDIAQLCEKAYPIGDPVPPFEDVKDEIFDMCRPSDPLRISAKELINSGKGDTIVGMLTDLNSFLAYECREDVVAEE